MKAKERRHTNENQFTRFSVGAIIDQIERDEGDDDDDDDDDDDEPRDRDEGSDN